jgi:hypothetical protein
MGPAMQEGSGPARDEARSPAAVVPVHREIRCEVGFVVARLRLLRLLHLGFLHWACMLACESALETPDGHLPRLLVPPRPAAVSIAEPEPGRGTVTVPLRWHADRGSGPFDRLLDASLAFTARTDVTAVTFDGVFRLLTAHDLEPAENVLALIAAAESCAESLLTTVAEALIRDYPAENSYRPGWRWITTAGQDPRLAILVLAGNGVGSLPATAYDRSS